MSKEGIAKVAALFSQMQLLRQELLHMGTTPKIDHADILLSHMLDEGKDAMKDSFMAITSGNFPRIQGRKARKIVKVGN